MPVGGVVTTPIIAQALTDRLHFNTFGGNLVVCAQGNRAGNLQANSLNIGNKILAALNELKKKYKLIGDGRGKGLLLCIESGIDN